MEPVSTTMAVIWAASAVADVVTGLMAAKDAKKINEQTYQRLLETVQTYEAEMEGLLPPGTVDPMKWEQFKAEVEKYVPEIAENIPEMTPQQVTESGSAEERQAQKEALRQFGQLAKTGYDPIAEAQQEAALAASAAQASSARQSALREAAQRGLGGTGLDVLAGLGATEQAAVSGRQAALQAQAEAGQRRLQALSQYGSMAGQMREQATGVEKGNVDIMNAFNERAARNLNQYNRYVSEMKNEADLFNLQNQQRRDEQLVTQRNQQMMFDVQRQEQAAENRRAARERMVTNKAGMRSGLGQLQGQMRGQELEKSTAAWGRGIDAVQDVSKIGAEQYFKSEFNKKNKPDPKP